MVNINPDSRNENWTEEIVNAAIQKYGSKCPAPVVIISYKRGGDASSIKLLKNTGVPVYLFVYDDDYENYRAVVESSYNIKVVLCPSKEFRGAAKKRDFVQKTLYESGVKEYFILDDDISALFYTVVGKTKAGKYKAQKVPCEPITFFQTWHYVIHELIDYEVTLGGIIAEFASWGQNLYKLPVTDKTGRICQIMYINAEKFAENDIKYVETKSWDDFDVMLTVLDKGLGLSQIRWLTYANDTMTPNNSVASGGDFTWTKKSMRLYQKWGDCVGFKADKGQLNTTINWSKIKKDLQVLGHLNITYKEEWKKYFFNNDTDRTQDNPFGLDYIGFTKLWENDINKWLEKHPQKTKKSKNKDIIKNYDNTPIEGQISFDDLTLEEKATEAVKDAIKNNRVTSYEEFAKSEIGIETQLTEEEIKSLTSGGSVDEL